MGLPATRYWLACILCAPNRARGGAGQDICLTRSLDLPPPSCHLPSHFPSNWPPRCTSLRGSHSCLDAEADVCLAAVACLDSDVRASAGACLPRLSTARTPPPAFRCRSHIGRRCRRTGAAVSEHVHRRRGPSEGARQHDHLSAGRLAACRHVRLLWEEVRGSTGVCLCLLAAIPRNERCARVALGEPARHESGASPGPLCTHPRRRTHWKRVRRLSTSVRTPLGECTCAPLDMCARRRASSRASPSMSRTRHTAARTHGHTAESASTATLLNPRARPHC
eukprot:365219-Chlamydomonas_euryale.AAC.53